MGSGKINSIHYLRGIAALMVVFYHLRVNLNNVYAQKDLGDLLFYGGAFGVDLFFIISGFIICYATEKKENLMAVKYVLRRFFRIYPLLIFSVLTAFFTLGNGYDFSLLIRSIIPLNENYSSGSPFFGYNLLGPAWTLTYEIAFYAIFMLSFSINHRFRWLIAILSILALVCGIQYHFKGVVTLAAYNDNSFANGSVLHAPLTFLSSPLFIDFIYGLVIYKIFTLTRGVKLPDYLEKALGVISGFVFLIAILSILSVQVYGHGPMLWGMWCAVLVVSGLCFEKFNTVKEIPCLNVLGDISYSLYLTHAIIIEAFQKYPDTFKLFNNHNGISQLIYLTIVSIFLAFWVHKLIEKPFIGIGKKVISKIS
ncbi:MULTISPECIES: acyltransferase family protein [Rahnella]|uniref:acyltransferase family protein n=1 Tax=Rahnella TaxID=34037 RepID=UPI003F6E0C54